MSDASRPSNDTDPASDERQIEELLQSLDAHQSSLPAGMLEQIKQFGDVAHQKGDSVEKESNPTPNRIVPTDANLPGSQSQPSTAGAATGNGRTVGARRMLVTRTIVSVVAVVIVSLGTFLFQAKDSQASLGAILDEVLKSETLQFRISRDGATAQVWIRESGQVRWQESKDKYLIANGSRLWRIDESSNTVTSEPDTWHDDSNRVDLFAMLGFSGITPARLNKARPVGKENIDGVECDVFRITVRDNERSFVIEAYADASRGLHSIACWPRDGGKRTGPPIAELRLIARNVPVDESKFIVAKSLTEDGRIGKIVDRQGIVSLKPVLRQRWTPVARNLLVQPGDWIRTDRRGANAVTLILTSGYRITVGPATLVEMASVDVVRVHHGEVQIHGNKTSSRAFKLIGPNKQELKIAKSASVLYRVLADGSFRKIKKKPDWLRGFEGSSTNESLGSLIANLKGGEALPLTIGYHKVRVEIRDQIARTTIEESFKNHTSTQLEGVFHFPLPQDASISGFGMWIDGKLVEADVVEKQRAREIYETILREKEDPALLEWTGGNIFKARIFPIEPHSEKRIQIVYTQVLPLRANRYRYSYGLRSEMLQTTPLRELSLDVKINSKLPLKRVHSPTHQVRSEQTKHSAHLEFNAQDYTPTRDFEIVCEVDAKQSDVVVIPHRRGTDGYFMVQLTPPSSGGDWQRELLTDGDPLDLLLVCDTSGSMNSHNRAMQSEFVSAVLAALGPDDRFNLAVADVDCQWLFPTSVAPSEKNVDMARRKLEERVSLGWTDLDRTFASLRKKAKKNSQIVYIGDGIATARDADPHAFVQRLEKMYGAESRGTMHAVSVGSSFESVVLRAMARLGGGSIRGIDGKQTPHKVALEILSEMVRPGLQDIKVDFRKVQVAAVYPGQLPNLAAGTQQILIGRYRPQGKDQSGEIVVTGKRGDETVRFAAKFDLTDDESGNSFVPRLWARAHLDQLLDQGSNSVVKDEIIGLSEDFHIITPFTSLLVLEDDEQRERFGVKRRYQMRDGERFFAEGRDNANFELRQKQMKRAGDWRLGLRRRILLELGGLGRDARLFQNERVFRTRVAQVVGNQNAMWNELSLIIGQTQVVDSTTMLQSGLGGGGGGGGGGGYFGGSQRNVMRSYMGSLWSDDSLLTEFQRSSGSGPDGSSPILSSSHPATQRPSQLDMGGEFAHAQLFGKGKQSLDLLGPAISMSGEMVSNLLAQDSNLRADRDSYNQSYRWRAQSINWLSELFPRVPLRPKARSTNLKWQARAIEVSNSLLRAPSIQELEGALQISRETKNFDPNWPRENSRSVAFELHSAERWLSWSTSPGSQKIVHWCNKHERGVLSTSFMLGQTRKTHPFDLRRRTIGAANHANSPLHLAYRDYDVKLEEKDAGIVHLILSRPENEAVAKKVLVVDTRRNVLLEERTVRDGRVLNKTVYRDFVEVAGVSWASTIESFDEQSRRVSLTTQTIKPLARKIFLARFSDELSVINETQVIQHPLPNPSESESAIANGTAKFEHHLIVMLQAAMIQKWDTVLVQLANLEKLADDMQGLGWMRASILATARRNEEARQEWIRLSKELLREDSTDLFAASFVIGKIRSVGDANEALAIMDKLKSVFKRQQPHIRGIDRWNQLRVTHFESLGRTAESLALRLQLAKSAPWNVNRQTAYARLVARTGDHAAGYKRLQALLDGDSPWTDYQLNQIRRSYFTMLKEQGRANEAVTFAKAWIETDMADQLAFSQYLTALIFADRTEEADATALKWIDAAKIDGKLEGHALSRCKAAIPYALGQRTGLSTYRIDDAWFVPLQKLAEFFLAHEHHFEFAERIMPHYRFQDSDEGDAARSFVAQRLKTKIQTLKYDRIGRYVEWVVYGDELTDEDWSKITEVLLKRRSNAKTKHVRKLLGDTIMSIYRSHFRDSKLLPFMRLRRKEATAEKDSQLAAQYANELMSDLLQRPWSEENEIELFSLIGHTSAADLPTARVVHNVATLHGIVDQVITKRIQRAQTNLQDSGHPEKLTRTELWKKNLEIETAARKALILRLAAEQDKHEGELGDWCRLERVYLDVKLARNLKNVARECWAMLGKFPPENIFDNRVQDDVTDEQLVQATDARTKLALLVMRVRRAVTTLMNLASRQSDKDDTADKLLAFIDKGIVRGGNSAAEWKKFRYQLLIALDRPDELERNLRTWIRQDHQASHWKRTLARLLAERGQFKEAISLVHAIRQSSMLTPADHKILADWHLVTDQRDAYQKSRIGAFKAVENWKLKNWLINQMDLWNDIKEPVPSELDENVVFAFQALFEKSANPAQHLWLLRQFYRDCHDFRLLRMVPDSVIGRTPQQVYAYIREVHDGLLAEVRKEATADEIITRIAELRNDVESPVDLRALDLLEAVVERKSSEVANQAGPHADAALAALKRAFDRTWQKGEPRQMAAFLAALGNLKQENLIDEQIRQLNELQRRTQAGTGDHLHISWNLANALFWSYNKRQEGMLILEIAIRDYEQTHPKGWPAQAATPADGYIAFHVALGLYAQGERFIERHIANPLNSTQQFWFIERLNELYKFALSSGAEVSLGKGDALLKNLVQRLLKQAETTNDSHRQRVLIYVPEVFKAAARKGVPTAKASFTKYALQLLPPILKRQKNEYTLIVRTTGKTLLEVVGARTALEFMIASIEAYPDRFNFGHSSAWSSHASALASWRLKVGSDLGDLEPRLLALVIGELKHELRTRYSRSRSIYYNGGNKHFWKAKADAFATAAEEVLTKRQHSARSVVYIANYLYSGLGRSTRAIEIMMIAHKDGRLDTTQQGRLCTWLQNLGRFGESLAILEPLVEKNQDNITFRRQLIMAYARTKRPQQAKQLIAATDAHFRAEGRWTENNIAALAACMGRIGNHQQAIDYYMELIPLHRRSDKNHGAGSSSLSRYYQYLADAHSALGHTREAVDAAASGVLVSSPIQYQRKSALRRLQSVLLRAKDMEQYVKYLDGEAERNGTDSPLVRQMCGEAYALRGQHERAVQQLKLSIQLQPTNIQARDKLIASLDKLGRKKQALQHVLKQIDIERHNLDRYEDLVKRTKDDDSWHERAITTIVEAAPTEHTHHQKTAMLRQKQGRWADAIGHWKQVAKLQTYEPDGLLGLAEAQFHEKKWDNARQTIQELKQTEWAGRFSDLPDKIKKLEGNLKRKPK